MQDLGQLNVIAFRHGGSVPAWQPGRSTVVYLLGRGRLEQVASIGVVEASDRVLARAELRLVTAKAGLEGGDNEGAFVAAYDSYRMAAESLLVRQGLRATGGTGSHVTVEESVSAQFSNVISAFAKPTFERFRRMRHAAQYFDPDDPELALEDAQWAIVTAKAAIGGIRRFDERGGLALFVL